MAKKPLNISIQSVDAERLFNDVLSRLVSSNACKFVYYSYWIKFNILFEVTLEFRCVSTTDGGRLPDTTTTAYGLRPKIKNYHTSRVTKKKCDHKNRIPENKTTVTIDRKKFPIKTTFSFSFTSAFLYIIHCRFVNIFWKTKLEIKLIKLILYFFFARYQLYTSYTCQTALIVW